MANRKNSRRTIEVDEKTYRWYVFDDSQNEGFWTVKITADSDWQKQIVFPLAETGISSYLDAGKSIPVPGQFDLETKQLSEYSTTDLGNDRHIPATPSLIRWLVEWYLENEWT